MAVAYPVDTVVIGSKYCMPAACKPKITTGKCDPNDKKIMTRFNGKPVEEIATMKQLTQQQVGDSMLQTVNQQCVESFRADQHLEDVQYTQEDEPSNDEWSAYKLDLTDCVDADSFEDNDDMFHSVHPSLFDAHNQFKGGNRKRGQDFADDSDLFSDIDSQTVTISMSSLKTTMKDRLAIVMQNICTYYDAYSFEKLQRIIS